jgi:hypothetical protein
VTEATDQVSQQVASVTASLASTLAAGACAFTGPAAIICIPIMIPATYYVVEGIADSLISGAINGKVRDEVVDALSDLNRAPYKVCTGNPAACTCGSKCTKPPVENRVTNGIITPVQPPDYCAYPTPGNQWINLASCKLAQRIDAIGLPEKVLNLPVPNFDEVAPFAPPYLPPCQQP